MTRYYLSGPMSGYPDHNAPQFNLCAQLLRERGYDICNPTEFDEELRLPWSDYLRKDIRALMDCGGVITLPGWQESRGASLEVYIAHALGMQVMPFSLAVTMAAPTLQAGGNSTGGDRPPGTTVDTCDSLIVTHTLRGKGFDASEDGHSIAVAFDTTQITSPTNRSNPKPGDPCHPLAAGAHAPAAAIRTANTSANGHGVAEDVAHTLDQAQGQAVAFQTRGSNVSVGDISGTIGTNADRASGGAPMVAAPMQVRRLTPRECERLQGLPDDYTLIPWRTWQEAQRKGVSYESLLAERGMRLREPAGEACPDGPRYKALGNSMAVPVMRWIGQRIDAVRSLALDAGKVAA